MLGAELSFEDAPRGLIRVRNKTGRIDEISALVERLAEDPSRCACMLPSLKGKLLFAASHVFGRCAQIATQLIYHAEQHQGPDGPGRVVAAVRRALETLVSAGDRQVNLWSEQPPVVLFTDGACEARSFRGPHPVRPCRKVAEFRQDAADLLRRALSCVGCPKDLAHDHA